MDTFEIRNNKAVYNDIEYDFDKLPKNVVFYGDINIVLSKLSTLPDMSTWTVKGDFDCLGNELTSLKGCPKEISGNFWCSYNNLTSLEYCPREFGGGFYCNSNKLTSLEHCPKKVGGYFDCSNNNISDVDAWPEYIGGDFYLNSNPVKYIKEGVMPLKYLIICYRRFGLANSKELLMGYTGCSSEGELVDLLHEILLKYIK